MLKASRGSIDGGLLESLTGSTAADKTYRLDIGFEGRAIPEVIVLLAKVTGDVSWTFNTGTTAGSLNPASDMAGNAVSSVTTGGTYFISLAAGSRYLSIEVEITDVAAFVWQIVE